MLRIKLALLAGGVVLAIFGLTEWKLAQGSKQTPQMISCDDLSAKGPGDNSYITLTDNFLCRQSIVCETKKNNPKWNKVWVPVVPKNGEYAQKIEDGNSNGPMPIPQNIKVILKSQHVADEAELGALANQPAITGLVTNEVESLGSKELEILRQNYPGTDFTKCWIVDHDRKPAGMAQIAGMTGGGVALFLLGVAWLVTGARSGSKA